MKAVSVIGYSCFVSAFMDTVTKWIWHRNVFKLWIARGLNCSRREWYFNQLAITLKLCCFVCPVGTNCWKSPLIFSLLIVFIQSLNSSLGRPVYWRRRHAVMQLWLVGYNEQSAACSIVWDDHFEVSVFVATTHILLPFILLIVLNCNLVTSLRKQNRNLVNQLDRELNVPTRFAKGSARHGRFLCGFIQASCWNCSYIRMWEEFQYVFLIAFDNLLYLVKSASLQRRTRMHFRYMYFLEFYDNYYKNFLFQPKKEKLLVWYFGL